MGCRKLQIEESFYFISDDKTENKGFSFVGDPTPEIPEDDTSHDDPEEGFTILFPDYANTLKKTPLNVREDAEQKNRYKPVLNRGVSGFRYFDWELGRFITRDPSGYPDGANNYLYCHNNPINFIDAFGLEVVVAHWKGVQANEQKSIDNFLNRYIAIKPGFSMTGTIYKKKPEELKRFNTTAKKLSPIDPKKTKEGLNVAIGELVQVVDEIKKTQQKEGRDDPIDVIFENIHGGEGGSRQIEDDGGRVNIKNEDLIDSLKSLNGKVSSVTIPACHATAKEAEALAEAVGATVYTLGADKNTKDRIVKSKTTSYIPHTIVKQGETGADGTTYDFEFAPDKPNPLNKTSTVLKKTEPKKKKEDDNK